MLGGWIQEDSQGLTGQLSVPPHHHTCRKWGGGRDSILEMLFLPEPLHYFATFLLLLCMPILPLCVCYACTCAHRNQKRVSYPLGLKSLTVVSCPVWLLRTKCRVLRKSVPFNHSALSPALFWGALFHLLLTPFERTCQPLLALHIHIWDWANCHVRC